MENEEIMLTPKSKWINKKLGNQYEIIGMAIDANNRFLDMFFKRRDRVSVVYRSLLTGKIFFRKKNEFFKKFLFLSYPSSEINSLFDLKLDEISSSWNDPDFTKKFLMSHLIEVQGLLLTDDPHLYAEIIDLINIANHYLASQPHQKINDLVKSRLEKFIAKAGGSKNEG